ncbi:MAG: ABC transporter ATP-binding protein [Firmicutes bacterium]|nr:ABC transporter ATP-binding protein [Bacillota bacterium]
MTAVLQENLTGIRVAGVFANQKDGIEKFEAKNRAHREKAYRLLWLLACY